MPPRLILRDRYELVREVGRGGAGAVFLARDRTLDRDVAVKVMHRREGGTDLASLDRFAREARLLVDLPHPALVPILDAALDGEPPFLVFPWMPGGDLRTRIRSGPATQEELVRHGSRLASALGHLHRHGVLHRDVKPENILLDARGEASLGDLGLGIGTELDPLTRTGVVVGTPRYMAPETLERGAHGPTSDLYSLGMVLLELCRGRSLEATLPTGAQVQAAVSELPEPALREILRRLLRTDPASRTADAGILATELTALGSGLAPVPAPTPGLLPLPDEASPTHTGFAPVALPGAAAAGSPGPRGAEPGDRLPGPVPGSPAARPAAGPGPTQASGGGLDRPPVALGRRSPAGLAVLAMLLGMAAGFGLRGGCPGPGPGPGPAADLGADLDRDGAGLGPDLSQALARLVEQHRYPDGSVRVALAGVSYLEHEASVVRELLDPRFPIRWARFWSALAAWAEGFSRDPEGRLALDREVRRHLLVPVHHLLCDLVIAELWVLRASSPVVARILGPPRADLAELGRSDIETVRSRLHELQEQIRSALAAIPMLRDPPGDGSALLRLRLVGLFADQDLEGGIRLGRTRARELLGTSPEDAAAFLVASLTCLPTMLSDASVDARRRRELYQEAVEFLRAWPPGPTRTHRLELAADLVLYWFSTGIQELPPGEREAAIELALRTVDEELDRDPWLALQVLTFTVHQETTASLFLGGGGDAKAEAHMTRVEAVRRKALALVEAAGAARGPGR